MHAEHILVLEDTKLVRHLLCSRFEGEGYEVTGTGKITDALQAVRAKMPDLVILDLALHEEEPDGGLTDGLAFLSLLRRIHRQVEIPVVIYSANRSPKVTARALSMGAAAVIDKKGDLSALLSAVRSALEARKSKQTSQPAASAVPEGSLNPAQKSVSA